MHKTKTSPSWVLLLLLVLVLMVAVTTNNNRNNKSSGNFNFLLVGHAHALDIRKPFFESIKAAQRALLAFEKTPSQQQQVEGGGGSETNRMDPSLFRPVQGKGDANTIDAWTPLWNRAVDLYVSASSTSSTNADQEQSDQNSKEKQIVLEELTKLISVLGQSRPKKQDGDTTSTVTLTSEQVVLLRGALDAIEAQLKPGVNEEEQENDEQDVEEKADLVLFRAAQLIEDAMANPNVNYDQVYELVDAYAKVKMHMEEALLNQQQQDKSGPSRGLGSLFSPSLFQKQQPRQEKNAGGSSSKSSSSDWLPEIFKRDRSSDNISNKDDDGTKKKNSDLGSSPKKTAKDASMDASKMTKEKNRQAEKKDAEPPKYMKAQLKPRNVSKNKQKKDDQDVEDKADLVLFRAAQLIEDAMANPNVDYDQVYELVDAYAKVKAHLEEALQNQKQQDKSGLGSLFSPSPFQKQQPQQEKNAGSSRSKSSSSDWLPEIFKRDRSSDNMSNKDDSNNKNNGLGSNPYEVAKDGGKNAIQQAKDTTSTTRKNAILGGPFFNTASTYSSAPFSSSSNSDRLSSSASASALPKSDPTYSSIPFFSSSSPSLSNADRFASSASASVLPMKKKRRVVVGRRGGEKKPKAQGVATATTVTSNTSPFFLDPPSPASPAPIFPPVFQGSSSSSQTNPPPGSAQQKQQQTPPVFAQQTTPPPPSPSSAVPRYMQAPLSPPQTRRSPPLPNPFLSNPILQQRSDLAKRLEDTLLSDTGDVDPIEAFVSSINPPQMSSPPPPPPQRTTSSFEQQQQPFLQQSMSNNNQRNINPSPQTLAGSSSQNVAPNQPETSLLGGKAYGSDPATERIESFIASLRSMRGEEDKNAVPSTSPAASRTTAAAQTRVGSEDRNQEVDVAALNSFVQSVQERLDSSKKDVQSPETPTKNQFIDSTNQTLETRYEFDPLFRLKERLLGEEGKKSQAFGAIRPMNNASAPVTSGTVAQNRPEFNLASMVRLKERIQAEENTKKAEAERRVRARIQENPELYVDRDFLNDQNKRDVEVKTERRPNEEGALSHPVQGSHSRLLSAITKKDEGSSGDENDDSSMIAFDEYLRSNIRRLERRMIQFVIDKFPGFEDVANVAKQGLEVGKTVVEKASPVVEKGLAVAWKQVGVAWGAAYQAAARASEKVQENAARTVIESPKGYTAIDRRPFSSRSNPVVKTYNKNEGIGFQQDSSKSQITTQPWKLSWEEQSSAGGFTTVPMPSSGEEIKSSTSSTGSGEPSFVPNAPANIGQQASGYRYVEQTAQTFAPSLGQQPRGSQSTPSIGTSQQSPWDRAKAKPDDVSTKQARMNEVPAQEMGTVESPTAGRLSIHDLALQWAQRNNDRSAEPRVSTTPMGIPLTSKNTEREEPEKKEPVGLPSTPQTDWSKLAAEWASRNSDIPTKPETNKRTTETPVNRNGERESKDAVSKAPTGTAVKSDRRRDSNSAVPRTTTDGSRLVEEWGNMNRDSKTNQPLSFSNMAGSWGPALSQPKMEVTNTKDLVAAITQPEDEAKVSNAPYVATNNWSQLAQEWSIMNRDQESTGSGRIDSKQALDTFSATARSTQKKAQEQSLRESTSNANQEPVGSSKVKESERPVSFQPETDPKRFVSGAASYWSSLGEGRGGLNSNTGQDDDTVDSTPISRLQTNLQSLTKEWAQWNTKQTEKKVQEGLYSPERDYSFSNGTTQPTGTSANGHDPGDGLRRNSAGRRSADLPSLDDIWRAANTGDSIKSAPNQSPVGSSRSARSNGQVTLNPQQFENNFIRDGSDEKKWADLADAWKRTNAEQEPPSIPAAMNNVEVKVTDWTQLAKAWANRNRDAHP